jgi:hypothetical protein
MRTNERKQLTRQNGLKPLTESTVRGRTSDIRNAPLVPLPSVDQCRSGVHTPQKETYCLFVPVVDQNQKPLMPTTPSRARRWIKNKKATPFFKRGVFCVRLNSDPSSKERQEIAIGIDPGSKKEGFTIKSKAHTFLNIQSDAVQHVSDAIEVRRNMRHARRFRKTPCRQNRRNRTHGCLPPSTRARWQWKLRIIEQLTKIFPVTDLVIEDIKAKTLGKRGWDTSFSPLEIGKKWFYEMAKRFGQVHLKQGWETKELRDVAGLKKSKNKTSEVFWAHCVDSWVLANWKVGGHDVPENTSMLCVAPIRLHRRQLHALQPSVGNIRRPYGGTRSCGLKRGSLVFHDKLGLTYVGGTMNKRISLHSIENGKRLCQNANPIEVEFKSYNTWKTRFLPALNGEVFARNI